MALTDPRRYVAAQQKAHGSLSATVGIIPIVDVAPLYLGDEQGFFEDHGIDLALESGQGGAAIVPGVVSGQFQFGFSNVTSLMVARDQGLPLKVVAPGNSSTGEDPDFSAVVVKDDSPIQSAKDLAGKTVAVNTLKNVGDTTIRESIRKDGGNPDDVEFVELAFPDMPAAVANGQVTLPTWSSTINEESTQKLADLAEQDGLLEKPADLSALLP